MPRFVCKQWPFYKIVTPKRVLAFQHGVLDTDEEGATVIRSLDLYGRRIAEDPIEQPELPLMPDVSQDARTLPLESTQAHSSTLPRYLNTPWVSSRQATSLDTAPQRVRNSRELAAAEFLSSALAGGPLPAREVATKAGAARIPTATLRRAKERLGVRSVKLGLRTGWVWMLLET